MTNTGHNHIPDAGDGAESGGNTPSNIPIDRVEWSRNTILEFIDDYRGFNVLWDPNTKGYHIKQIKYEALKKLSRKYRTEVRVIRSKIKSLRSSFHREHGKVISGKRRGVSYQPMWFAYEAIRFILDGERNETEGNPSYDAVCCVGGGRERGNVTDVFAAVVGADTVSNGIDANDELMTFTDQINDPHYANISAADVKTEILETSNGETESMPGTNKLLGKSKRQSSKDASSSHQTQIYSDSDNLPSSQSRKSRKTDTSGSDEYGVFGEYVGITIRKLKTSKAKVVIKHLINNLLYEAEMGRYDYGIATTREPPHLYATTDS